jgi:hypothetical protein
MKEYGIVDSGDKLKLGIGAMTDQRWSDFYHTMVKAGSSRRASTIRRSAPSSSPTTASASICARALARKPGALRNGAPFKDWVLPAALDRVRRKLAGSDDGDRQMVKILAAVLSDGLAVVEAACVQALAESVHSADVILNILARRRDPRPSAPIHTPASLRLRHVPVADCARYDRLTHGTNRSPRHDERPQALGDEERQRRDAGPGDQAQARTAALRRRSLEGRDPLDQVPAHGRQAAAGQGPRTLRLQGHAYNEALERDLAGGGFIGQQHNVVFTGGTGTGKTHLAIAIA